MKKRPLFTQSTISEDSIYLTLTELRLIDYALHFYYLRAERGALEPVRTTIASLHEKFSAHYIPERERRERLRRVHSQDDDETDPHEGGGVGA